MSDKNFQRFFTHYSSHITAVLERALPPSDTAPARLHRAMRYALLNGGKRIRPLLIYAVGETFQGDLFSLDTCACAVEIIHGYSLIHDDLPVMDNDDLRRGLPTCHRAFDEATAILAGDALQALAFEILATPHPSIAAVKQLCLLRVLAHACGSLGMAGGQTLDIQATKTQFSVPYIENMYRKKTGALITASVELAAMVSNCTVATRQHLKDFASFIGLAFQIQDDILDIEKATEVLGKRQGADIAAGKLTYPQATSLSHAKQRVTELHQQALSILAILAQPTTLLASLADYLVTRDN